MAYDAAREVTVLFGGSQFSNRWNDDTWEWNGTAWTQRLVTGPAPRFAHEMTYDAARGVTVLFGGELRRLPGHADDTWEWNGVAWTQRALAGPSPRSSHAIAHDTARDETVLFGGQGIGGGIDSNDETWVLTANEGGAPSTFWLGLKNSDDQGDQFDLRTEASINSTLVSVSELRCITGLTRNPAFAKEVKVPAGPGFAAGAGNLLSVRLVTRIGTNADDTKCSGSGGSHNNASGLRLYFDGSARPSRVANHFTSGPFAAFFLHATGTPFSVLGRSRTDKWGGQDQRFGTRQLCRWQSVEDHRRLEHDSAVGHQRHAHVSPSRRS